MSYPIEKITIVNIITAYNKVTDKVALVLKQFDITIPQFNVLRILRGQKGKPATLAMIQERMISKMSNTTRLVDKLIKKELVVRSTCEHNRRKVDIIITDKGLAVLKAIDPVIEGADKKMMAKLSIEDMNQLCSLLSKIQG